MAGDENPVERHNGSGIITTLMDSAIEIISVTELQYLSSDVKWMNQSQKDTVEQIIHKQMNNEIMIETNKVLFALLLKIVFTNINIRTIIIINMQ
jgi:hypothetical protein